jgi:eukaryotic-like serine/threonine-protein kinase
MPMLSAKERTSTILLPGLQMSRDAIAGRYRVEKLLGAGSSGFVVLARHVYLGRRVTLKILASMTNTQQQAKRRCLAAAHVAASLRGPHVARVIDTGFTEEGMPFIATEHLEGRTLLDERKERGKVPTEEAVRWVLQACEALAEAHAGGIVHGDLKPQNLFLAVDKEATDDDHEERSLKILDFGMSVGMGDSDDGEEGTSSTWFASPAYLAPEQLQDPHHLDPRVDVWALGVILHELIAGTLPFDAASVSGMLIAVVHNEPDTLTGPDAPSELARVVLSCLAKNASERPPDMVTLARVLAPFAGVEGPALLARVAGAYAVANAPRPVDAADVAVDDEAFGVSHGAHGAGATTRTSMLPFLEARRRRRRVIAKLAAAAALIVVAIIASPSGGSTTEPTDLPRVPAEEMAPHPFVPHSFEPQRPRGNGVQAPAPRPPVPEAAPQLAPHAQRWKTPQPAAKPRATLAVRENPYGLRPQRPAAHRNHPR